jgi:hypothetical protein
VGLVVGVVGVAWRVRLVGGCVHGRITEFHVLESPTPWSLVKLFGFLSNLDCFPY